MSNATAYSHHRKKERPLLDAIAAGIRRERVMPEEFPCQQSFGFPSERSRLTSRTNLAWFFEFLLIFKW